MNKAIIKFTADEQELVKTEGIETYASNIVSYIEAEFTLGENWSGYDEVRAIWQTDEVVSPAPLDAWGKCVVPAECLASKSKVKVNLVGSIADGETGDLIARLTTFPVTAFKVSKEALVDGDAAPITPTQFEQFVAVVDEGARDIQTFMESARGYAQTAMQEASNAASSASSANGASQAAYGYVGQAGEAADTATAQASNASASAASASASATSASESAASASADATTAEASATDAETAATAAQTAATAAEGYAESASADASTAETAKDLILGMTAEAETLPAGSSATASYEDGVLTLGIPQGAKGNTGTRGNRVAITTIAPTAYTTTIGTYTPSYRFPRGSVNTEVGFVVIAGDVVQYKWNQYGVGAADTNYLYVGDPVSIRGAKGDTGDTGNGIESIDLTSTVGSVKTYTITFTDGTTTTFDVTDGEVTEASLAETLEDYAKTEGEYADLDAGNLVTDDIVGTSTAPYFFRPSPSFSGATYSKERDKVVGGSVAWNQLFTIQPFSKTGGTITTDSDGVATFIADGSGQQGYRSIACQAYSVYMFLITFKTTTASADIKGRMFAKDVATQATTAWQTVGTIAKIANTGTQTCGVVDRRSSGWDAIEIKPIVGYNLTQMFGSTIADHAYSLEQQTSGKGVEFISKLIDLTSYHAYDSGSIKSVEGLVSHDMVGFNQWDEEWESGTYLNASGAKYPSSAKIRNVNPIKVISGTAYYWHVGTTSTDEDSIFCYDADMNFIRRLASSHGATVNLAFTTPSNCEYINFAIHNTTYNHDICINISDPSKNGTYEPYQKHSYPLDSSLTLRGVPKLSNGEVYYDGDTYESDGTVTRKYGVVDLGTLDWLYRNSRFDATVNGGKLTLLSSGGAGAVCSKYPKESNAYTSMPDKSVIFGSGYVNGSTCSVIARDSAYTDATAFKTAMNGVYLVYELATPTTESATPYTNPQIVDPYGTEEYVTDGVLAVGHSTEYPADLKAKLEGLPWNFSAMIAPTEKTNKASRNYTSGSLLIMNNILYKVTANIANGGTITPNTNVTATTLSEVISAL